MGRLTDSWSRILRSPAVLRALAYTAGGVLLLFVAALGAIYFALRASLPQIAGEISAPILQGSATIERDASGMPAIRAGSRRDLAFATGVAHAQDRFFQMDLMRRAAAGELAALLGPSLVDTDRILRRHRFRSVAAQVIDASSTEDRELLDAYAAGVNLALDTAKARPWEYLLLRSQAASWRSEDSLLVAFSMYLDLQDSTGRVEIERGYLRETLPADLFAFLHPVGTEWDAPIVGSAWRTPPIPGPEVIDLRTGTREPVIPSAQPSASAIDRAPTEEGRPGSNAWAVAGSHTDDGRALLANDMHLGLRVPNVWYPARLIVEGEGRNRRDLAGVTLPGLPLMIVGSNGTVAWGYTNSYGDWTDVVVMELDAADPTRYVTDDGAEAFEVHREVIEVNGSADVEYEFKTTRFGPIVETDAHGRVLALAWTAHRAGATNLGLLDFETADSIESILDRANRAGAPVQNFLAVDAAGRIGWTLMGQLPLRGNHDSTVPVSWRDGAWRGWRAAQDYPRLIDPPAARLWSANARPIDAETWFELTGDGGYDLGARAAQIRDTLLSSQATTAEDMAALQIDDRALFLTRWRDLLLEVLVAPADIHEERYAEARELVENWSGRASAEDRGYRIVRAFRDRVRSEVFEALIEPARRKFTDARFAPSSQFEGPLWRIVTERPMHLLPARHATWQDALFDAFTASLEGMLQRCTSLDACTWGQQNALSMRHPLSSALPIISRWLDMPASAMNGDTAMPRVQGPAFGASQRLVVSPGRESEALFQMPGGPVGHPLSPFYGTGHEQWVRGESRPLLPGRAEHVLELLPQG